MGERTFPYIYYLKANKANSDTVINFIKEYLKNLTHRFLYIGENIQPKDMIYHMEDFKTYFIKFVEMNRNNNCLKYMLKNNSYIKSIFEELSIPHEDSSDINVAFLASPPTTCNVETSFSILKHKQQYNQYDLTTKCKMLLHYNIKGNGHDLFDLHDYDLYEKLEYPFIFNMEGNSGTDYAESFDGLDC